MDPIDTEHDGGLDLRLRALDLSVAIRCPDAVTHAAVAAAWNRCLDRSSAGVTDLEISLEPGDAARALIPRLSFNALEAAGSQRLLLRACAVADDRGQVLALVGGTPKRKKMAILEYARDSFGYVTDEVLAVGPSGDVLGVARPLALDEPDLPGRERGLRGPDELGLRAPTGSLRLSRIVILDYQHDRQQPPVIDRMSLGDGIDALARHLRPPDEVARPLQHLCELIEQCGGVHRLSFAGIEDTPDLVHELLDSSRPEERMERWEPIGAPSTDHDSVIWALMDGRVRQVPYRDAVCTDEEFFVVTQGSPVRLSPLGLTVWREAETAPTLHELTDRVVEEHGPHPEADALVREAVVSMTRARVLGHALPRTLAQINGSAEPRAAASRPGVS